MNAGNIEEVLNSVKENLAEELRLYKFHTEAAQRHETVAAKLNQQLLSLQDAKKLVEGYQPKSRLDMT